MSTKEKWLTSLRHDQDQFGISGGETLYSHFWCSTATDGGILSATPSYEATDVIGTENKRSET